MTTEEISAGLKTIQAIAGAIRELGEVPSGTLYANIMGRLTLEEYAKIIGILKNAGIAEETPASLLRWLGPR